MKFENRWIKNDYFNENPLNFNEIGNVFNGNPIILMKLVTFLMEIH